MLMTPGVAESDEADAFVAATDWALL